MITSAWQLVNRPHATECIGPKAQVRGLSTYSVDPLPSSANILTFSTSVHVYLQEGSDQSDLSLELLFSK